MIGDSIQIVEVGPRDGLQNEAVSVSTGDKIELINRMAAAGAARIEVASFVHPRLVPQMADAEDVVSGLDAMEGVSRIGLVLNRRGLERALQTDVEEVNFVVGASESFTQANQRASVATTIAEIAAMLPEAKAAGLATTVTISVAFGCPYEGEVPVGSVVDLVEQAVAAGSDEIALADTIGVAAPGDVSALVAAVRASAGESRMRCHFHDTRNTGVANGVAAITAGVRVLDASVGGTGGCPYAPNATGNVATEDVVYTLHRMGHDTGLDLDAVIATGHWMAERLGRTLPSALGRAGTWP
ncbi:MAG: hydroxymethylglutaryl-CoA lyase [Acidimicrobiia bacterium]|nr:hydroxymethylglutaryl-CoA lyase [Acidimicrobiia bacterium]